MQRVRYLLTLFVLGPGCASNPDQVDVRPTTETVTEVNPFEFHRAMSYGFLALLMVEANGFQSIDKSWPGFWIFLLRVGVITIPLGWFLTKVMGYNIYGIWGAIIAGNVIAAIVGMIWIRKKLNSLQPVDLDYSSAEITA